MNKTKKQQHLYVAILENGAEMHFFTTCLTEAEKEAEAFAKKQSSEIVELTEKSKAELAESSLPNANELIGGRITATEMGILFTTTHAIENKEVAMRVREVFRDSHMDCEELFEAIDEEDDAHVWILKASKLIGDDIFPNKPQNMAAACCNITKAVSMESRLPIKLQDTIEKAMNVIVQNGDYDD